MFYPLNFQEKSFCTNLKKKGYLVSWAKLNAMWGKFKISAISKTPITRLDKLGIMLPLVSTIAQKFHVTFLSQYWMYI